jgi:hypothetical protein
VAPAARPLNGTYAAPHVSGATETVSGLVELVNARRTGIRVAGQWLNVSHWHPLAELPRPGQRVDVQVQHSDRGLWIQSFEVLDGGQVHQLPAPPRRAGGRQFSDPRDIRRLAVLKAAAAFGASRPNLKSREVLAIADCWLAWVERPDGQRD